MNKFEIKKIRSHWDVDFGFSLLPTQVGLAFYPVEFRGEKYYVELMKFSHGTLCLIYSYGNEKRLFTGYKRSLLWKKELDYVLLEDGKKISVSLAYMPISPLPEQHIKLHLPAILKGIFLQYEHERERDKLEAKEIFDNTVKWDGVIH